MEEERIVCPGLGESDNDIEQTLRPRLLEEYIGQDKVKENMRVYIEAAKKRGETLDHTLLYGPPGLGKTTLSNIIANEMGSNIKITSGPAIEKPGDLDGIVYTPIDFERMWKIKLAKRLKAVGYKVNTDAII